MLCSGVYRVLVYVVMVVVAGRSIGEWSAVVGGAHHSSPVTSCFVESASVLAVFPTQLPALVSCMWFSSFGL